MVGPDLSELENTVNDKGLRKQFNLAVDGTGLLASAKNPNRKVLVAYNLGPNTVWANTALVSATPALGFPILVGGALIEDESFDNWYFRTASSETADVRGWEVETS